MVVGATGLCHTILDGEGVECDVVVGCVLFGVYFSLILILFENNNNSF